MRNDQTFSHNLAREDWVSLSALLSNINMSNIKNKALRRKLQFIKNVVHLHISNFNGSKEIDASVFVGAVKTLFSIEKDLNGTNHDFLLFYKMLLHKFACQKLVVNKLMEKRLEFKKMKRVMEA